GAPASSLCRCLSSLTACRFRLGAAGRYDRRAGSPNGEGRWRPARSQSFICDFFWIEKSMKMHDEIAHVGIVHSLLRLCPPRRLGALVVREDADDVEPVQVPETQVFQRI